MCRQSYMSKVKGLHERHPLMHQPTNNRTVEYLRDPWIPHPLSSTRAIRLSTSPQTPFLGPLSDSPPLFRQANLDHFERIVEAVVEWVPEGSGVCELYAGVGVLGLNCALKARFVRCSDVNSFNPRSFERSR